MASSYNGERPIDFLQDLGFHAFCVNMEGEIDFSQSEVSSNASTLHFDKSDEG